MKRTLNVSAVLGALLVLALVLVGDDELFILRARVVELDAGGFEAFPLPDYAAVVVMTTKVFHRS